MLKFVTVYGSLPEESHEVTINCNVIGPVREMDETNRGLNARTEWILCNIKKRL